MHRLDVHGALASLAGLSPGFPPITCTVGADWLPDGNRRENDWRSLVLKPSVSKKTTVCPWPLIPWLASGVAS